MLSNATSNGTKFIYNKMMNNIKKLCQEYRQNLDEISIYEIITDKFIIKGPDDNTTISYECKYIIRLLKDQREILIECGKDPHSAIKKYLEQIYHFSESSFDKIRRCEASCHSFSLDESVENPQLALIRKEIMNNKGEFIIEHLELGTIHQKINYYNNYDVQIDYRLSESYVSCSLVKSDNQGDKYSDYDFNYLNPSWINEKFNPMNFLNKIKANINSKLNSTPIVTGLYNCIIQNKLVCSLLEKVVNLLCGSKLVQKKSLFLDKLNEKIFNSSFNLVEIPDRGPHKFVWDDFGNSREKLYLFKNGVLNSYILSHQNGQRLKIAPKNHTIFFEETYGNIHLELEDNKSDLDSSYLIVQDFIGLQINDNDGNFSASCSGAVMKDNKNIGGFNNGIIKGNLLDLFDRCSFLSDVYSHSQIFAPSIFIRDFKINGSSAVEDLIQE